MNADGIRKWYDYHLLRNRQIWDRSIMQLTDEQFTQEADYSVGSIRNQTVHLMGVDARWFAGLRGDERPDFPDPIAFPNRAAVRARWDEIEDKMRDTLTTLTDDRLSEVFTEGMRVWEVLLHVINHGTDHRAQMLAMLHDLDVPTFPQDYAYYALGIEV